jgi:hypothetical protein
MLVQHPGRRPTDDTPQPNQLAGESLLSALLREGTPMPAFESAIPFYLGGVRRPIVLPVLSLRSRFQRGTP